jgi:hypothetical protein
MWILARVSNARNLPLMNLGYVTPKVCGPYAVTILDWAPIYIVNVVVKNGHCDN